MKERREEREEGRVNNAICLHYMRVKAPTVWPTAVAAVKAPPTSQGPLPQCKLTLESSR